MSAVHLAHVVVAGEAEQAAPLVEQIVDLVDAHAGVAREVDDHGGVDVAGARPHDEALERRQPHRGVDGSAVQHRRGRCPVAEVQHDLA